MSPPGHCRRCFGSAGGGQRGRGLRCMGKGTGVCKSRLSEPLSLWHELRVGFFPSHEWVWAGLGMEAVLQLSCMARCFWSVLSGP